MRFDIILQNSILFSVDSFAEQSNVLFSYANET